MSDKHKLDLSKVGLWYNGTNEAYVTSQLSSDCKLDLTSFPFDKQTCDIKVRNEVSSSEGNQFEIYSIQFLIVKYGQTIAIYGNLWNP